MHILLKNLNLEGVKQIKLRILAMKIKCFNLTINSI